VVNQPPQVIQEAKNVPEAVKLESDDDIFLFAANKSEIDDQNDIFSLPKKKEPFAYDARINNDIFSDILPAKKNPVDDQSSRIKQPLPEISPLIEDQLKLRDEEERKRLAALQRKEDEERQRLEEEKKNAEEKQRISDQKRREEEQRIVEQKQKEEADRQLSLKIREEENQRLEDQKRIVEDQRIAQERRKEEDRIFAQKKQEEENRLLEHQKKKRKNAKELLLNVRRTKIAND